MKRWICPICERAVNAPERPRKDDVRRYCLRCSEMTGRLVERTCPVLEKRRGTALARRKDKRQRATERERDKWTVGALDVRAVAQRCWKVLQKLGYVHARRELPKIYLMRTTRGTRGWAHSHGTVRLYFGVACDEASVRELVLHELCHHIDGAFLNKHHHGPRFNGALCDAARELWGFDEMDSGEGYGPSTALRQWLIQKGRDDGTQAD